MAKLFYSLLCMLMLVQVATAQTPTLTPTSTPAPWPPDPHAIFAEGVQWKIVPPPPSPPTETPYVEPTYNPEPPRACGGVTSEYALAQGAWVVAYPVENDRRYGYLCNSQTGEQRQGLPPNEYGYDHWDVYTTPDKTKLLLGLQFEFFVYDLVDKSYIKLGDAIVWSESDMLLCRWITNTLGILCSRERQGRSYFPEEYFAFDITQPDSVTAAFKGWENDTFYEEDLNRYISLVGTQYAYSYAGGPFYDEDSHIPCIVTVYDAQGLRQRELGYDCQPVFDEDTHTPFYRYGDYLYYLVVEDDETALTSLYRYSIVDETVTIIAEEVEITNIMGVSPDEQYIVVLMDDDLKRSRVYPGAGGNYTFTGFNLKVVIFEIATGEVIYITEKLGVYSPHQLTWMNDTTFLLSAQMSDRDQPVNGSFIKLASVWRIELPEKTTSTHRQIIKTLTMTDASLDLPSPNGIYGFIYSFAGKKTLMDLRTFDPLPLLQNSLGQYHLEFEWESDHALLVMVQSSDWQSSITYRVTLP